MEPRTSGDRSALPAKPGDMTPLDDRAVAERLLAVRHELVLLADDLVARITELEPLVLRLAASHRPAPASHAVSDLRAVIVRYQRWNPSSRAFDLDRSVRQYAALLDVSPAALSRYLAGERPLPLALVQSFLGHFPDAVHAVASALLVRGVMSPGSAGSADLSDDRSADTGVA